jgi:hypothetical protein
MQNFSSTALGSTLVRQICESADLPLIELSANQVTLTIQSVI